MNRTCEKHCDNWDGKCTKGHSDKSNPTNCVDYKRKVIHLKPIEIESGSEKT